MKFFIMIAALMFAGNANAEVNFVLTTQAGLDTEDWRAGVTGKPGTSLTVAGDCLGTDITGTFTEKTVNLNNPTTNGKNVQVKAFFKWAPSNNAVFYDFYAIKDGGEFTCTDTSTGTALVLYKYFIQDGSDLVDLATLDECITKGFCKDKYGRVIDSFKGVKSGNAQNDAGTSTGIVGLTAYKCDDHMTAPCGYGWVAGRVVFYSGASVASPIDANFNANPAAAKQWVNGVERSNADNGNAVHSLLINHCSEYDSDGTSPPQLDCNSTDCGSMNGTACDTHYEQICSAVCGG